MYTCIHIYLYIYIYVNITYTYIYAQVVVPQGIIIGRDGKVFHNTGLAEPGQVCKCKLHAGFPNSDLTCSAHGPAMGWTPQLTNLAIYPPKERWTGPTDNPIDSESTIVAREV